MAGVLRLVFDTAAVHCFGIGRFFESRTGDGPANSPGPRLWATPQPQRVGRVGTGGFTEPCGVRVTDVLRLVLRTQPRSGCYWGRIREFPCVVPRGPVYIQGVLSAFTKPLDRLAIRMACGSVRSVPNASAQAAEAEQLLRHPDFFSDGVQAPADLVFTSRRDFRFTSPISTPWRENNTVYGKLHRAGRDWQNKPAVILLHGWNGELGYRWQFPYLAWRLGHAGVNTAMIELPYHAQRRPTEPGAIQNFISHDLLRMVEATRQAIADTRALVAWLLEQGAPSVGLWGVSMGAWLSGLLACCEPRVRYAVLMTPVVRMDRVVQELPFCEPIRRSLKGTSLQFHQLNLDTDRPLTGPTGILIVASQHDLFASAETVENLWSAWGQPEIWRCAHGHISVLMSLPVMERTIRWVARKATPIEPAVPVPSS